MIQVQIKNKSLLDATLHTRLINLFSTIKGTVPYMRDFGISGDALDMPTDRAVNYLAAEMAEACEQWEPSVRVASVTPDYKNCAEGRVTMIVEVVDNG